MSTRIGTGFEPIDTSQSSEFIALGAAVMLAVVIAVLFVGQQVAQVILTIGAGLQI